MLDLFVRNLIWTAWWPVSVWLLTLEKAAAKQRPEAPEPPPAAQAFDKGQVPQQERIMANELKPEVPESVRDLVKLSIEQAKRAFDTFVATSEKNWKTFGATSDSARSALLELNAKIAEITRENAEANFTLAMRLAESKDFKQALELQSEHAKKQMEAFAQQLEAMRDLAAQLIENAKQAAAAAGPKSSSHVSDSPSYRRSGSSFTPRGGSSW